MGHLLRAGGQQVIDLSLGEPIHKRDGHISIEQQPLAGIGVGDVGELVLGNAQLLGEDRPVTLDVYKRQADVNIHGIFVPNIHIIPDERIDLRLGIDPFRILQKQFQNIKFLGCQFQ